MERTEGKPEGRLMAAIFGGDGLGFYPYVVVEEKSVVRMYKLEEALKEALATLPPREQKELELRFGLLDGIPRTLKEVGKELASITGEAARRIEIKALRRLRHPKRALYLKPFIIPLPEKIAFFQKEISRLRDENRALDGQNQKLKKILVKYSLSEKDGEESEPEKAPFDAKALAEDQAALRNLAERFPDNKRVWNALRRWQVTELSKLQELVKSGEIRKFKGIGAGGEKFLQEILQK